MSELVTDEQARVWAAHAPTGRETALLATRTALIEALGALVEASDLPEVEAYKDQVVMAPIEFFQDARTLLARLHDEGATT